MRAVAFLALAAFVALIWTALVADPPIAATWAVAGLATAAGVAIARLPGSTRRPWATAAARVLVLVLAGLAGLAVIGLPLRLLLPAGWSELGDGIGRGLVALEIRNWPYDGSDEWVRRTVLSVMPLALTGAAALAFWPARRATSALRIGAVGLLVLLYSVAIVQDEPAAPLRSGTLLFGLLAAWLFLPEARGRALAGGAMLVAAGGLSLPLAAILPAGDPIIDYRSIGLAEQHHFVWDHTYGPIDWPRDRQVVLRVDSAEPHYWKAVTLDEFDGDRWIVSASDVGAHPLAELPGIASRRWRTQVTVNVASIDSSVLFAPGPILGARGLSQLTVGDDGTAWTSDALGPGDSYVVQAYAPDPSASRMRRAADRVPRRLLRYTRFELPGGPGQVITPAGPIEGTTTVTLARAGNRRAAGERLLLDSPYARTYRLARSLAAPAPSNYDAVRRIEEYLRSNYRYGERPPERSHPLPAFLFRDRVGYCQQFSGAMALMLRMAGIPARVASGFAPGESDGTSWVVRDLDAHSWVEVYFRGIGWVPFDPTPPGAPAASISNSGAAVSAARGNQTRIGPLIGLGDLGRVGDFNTRRPVRPTTLPTAKPAGVADGGVAGVTGSGAVRIPLAPIAGGLAAIACLMATVGLRRWMRRRAAAGELGELRAAVATLDSPLEPGATLAQVERRVRERGGSLAARHVGLLRERRYGPEPIPPLDRRARRAFRRTLSAGTGPLGRLRGYAALPPQLRSPS